jgi:hypothetical protein
MVNGGILMATDGTWMIDDSAIAGTTRPHCHKEAKGGYCLVAQDTVCRPIEPSGLGISNLGNLSWALRLRGLWLQKTESHRPWSTLSIQVPDQVGTFFL